MNSCPHCEELRAEIEYLKSELGLRDEPTSIEALRQSLGLSHGEARFALILYRAKGRAVTRWQAMEAMPSPSGADDDRNVKLVDVYASKVRKRLGFDTIHTVWGRGYAITPIGARIIADALAEEQPAGRAA